MIHDYGEKSKGLEVFTVVGVLFWAKGRKTLPRCGAVTPSRGRSKFRQCAQNQSDI